MAGFIDPLAIMLISLAMSTLIGSLYFLFTAMNRTKDIQQLLIPAMGIGFFDFVSGYFMSFTWPLPSSYNMLFGDPLMMLGLLLIISAAAIYKGYEIKFNSILFLFLGIYVLVASAGIVSYKLETGDDLISAMGLYIIDGIAALLAPILFIEPKKGKYLYYLEFILLILGTLVALFIGYEAIYGHLLDFIKWFP
ncbi:MAG: DUF981 family protein [Thermoplasmata archaeon]